VPGANLSPTAVIDSIDPNPAGLGDPVTFTGHGTDIDGTIAGYEWRSSAEDLGASASFVKSDFSEGVHTIFFRVQDDDLEWSPEVSQTLIVGAFEPDIIVDNGGSGTSSTGSWSPSSAPNPYGANSLWARDGATYTWHADLPVTGVYEVYMWWTEWASRSTAAPVTIEYSGGSAGVAVNQRQNGGMWNLLGTYGFDAADGATVTITAEGSYPTSYCADAVGFVYLSGENVPPVASIVSIDPSVATEGTLVTFTGSGTDVDGTIGAYEWRSSIQGDLGTSASFARSDLWLGIHTIFLRVQDDQLEWSPEVSAPLVIEEVPPPNVPPVASIGSIAPNPATEGTLVTFTGSGTDTDGTIGAYEWRSDIQPGLIIGTSASFARADLVVGTHTIFLRVQDDDLEWSPEVSSPLTIEEGPPPTNIPPVASIDSIDPNPATEGTLVTFTGSGTDVDGTVIDYSWSSNIDGPMESGASITDSTLSIGAHTISFQVQDDDLEWSAPVTAPLVIEEEGTPDNVLPEAFIDLIDPNPAGEGDLVSFVGHGTDSDGTVGAYEWRSSIDGPMESGATITDSTLSAGTHTIFFRVRDDDLEWSPEVNETLVVGDTPSDLVVDNGDPGTSTTGIWHASAAPGFFGTESLWGRDHATYTWHADLPETGAYQAYVWYAEYPSRSQAAPIEVHHATGSDAFTLNQQQGGGMWNYLGTFGFDAADGATVVLTAEGYPTTYSADAVGFVYLPGENAPPTATIDTVDLNPSPLGESVDFIGYGTDMDGTIAGCTWESSLDGPLSASFSFSTSGLSEGCHIVSFRVQDDQGAWSRAATRTVDITGAVSTSEPIFAFFLYSHENLRPRYATMLENIGAYREGDNRWVYRNESLNKTNIIHLYQGIGCIPDMAAALRTPGAHLIPSGHSNYGLGAVFSTIREINEQVIEDVQYVDDDRIFNYSSPWIHVNISGMRTGQAYPFWWPIFQDDYASAVMPHYWGDPRGDPPYNYYPTYQVPGDPTHYMVETVRMGAVERFNGSDVEPWYSPTGDVPDPANPDHHQYYILNPAVDYTSFQYYGNWTEIQYGDEHFKESYLRRPAGSGANWAEFIFRIDDPGDYVVSAWWPDSSSYTYNAPYTIGGTTTVLANQRVNGGQWNELATLHFDAGESSVLLTDDADGGYVCADAVRVASGDNPPEIVQADFYASIRSGPAPLEVSFRNQSTGDFTERHWVLGDGYENVTRDRLDHTYTEPGTYTVSLTVSGPAGSDTRTKVDYITVGDGEPPLQAEFGAYGYQGSPPLNVYFRDRSSGSSIVSWDWDFGDGSDPSYEQSPTHTYTDLGLYTVSLTVTDGDGFTETETKENFVAVVLIRTIDNTDYPLTHFGSKTVLFRREPDIEKDEFEYARMLYDSCNTGNYYVDTFNRGIMYYTLRTSDSRGSVLYLEAYLQGKSNQEIWEIIQAYDPTYDYYDFTRTPDDQDQ
jgi:PKD repeat protein